MKDLVRDTIEKYELIDNGDKVVVGVSGGHDSMTLLYVLLSLRDELGFSLVVAHINHGVRGLESDGDEEYVRQVSNKLGIPFYSKKADMNQYGKIHKLTSEEAGREIRYDFFRQVIETELATKIAVAHNKNDQAETLLMRFMRGTGIDGLRGMEYKSGNIIRPLLGVDRSLIEEYCKQSQIDPRIDATNKMTIYGRNKVRLELIPYIEDEFNSGIISTLFRTSEIMKTDSDFLTEYTKSSFRETVLEIDEKKISLDILKLKILHSAILSRVLRSAIQEINMNLKGVEKKHIEDIVDLMLSDKTGLSLDLCNDIKASIIYDTLVLEKGKKMKEVKNSYQYDLKTHQTLYIPELNSEIYSEVYDRSDVQMDLNNSLVKYFDYDKINSDIYVRNRRNGDKFIPIGMSGHKKLKDFFIDQKIPKEERDLIPIVLDGEEILWVIGLRISEKYKVSEQTKRVLVLEYKLKEENHEKWY